MKVDFCNVIGQQFATRTIKSHRKTQVHNPVRKTDKGTISRVASKAIAALIAPEIGFQSGDKAKQDALKTATFKDKDGKEVRDVEFVSGRAMIHRTSAFSGTMEGVTKLGKCAQITYEDGFKTELRMDNVLLETYQPYKDFPRAAACEVTKYLPEYSISRYGVYSFYANGNIKRVVNQPHHATGTATDYTVKGRVRAESTMRSGVITTKVFGKDGRPIKTVIREGENITINTPTANGTKTLIGEDKARRDFFVDSDADFEINEPTKLICCGNPVPNEIISIESSNGNITATIKRGGHNASVGIQKDNDNLIFTTFDENGDSVHLEVNCNRLNFPVVPIKYPCFRLELKTALEYINKVYEIAKKENISFNSDEVAMAISKIQEYADYYAYTY